MQLRIPSKYYPLTLFLILAVASTVISAGLYATTCHILRSAANDPQIEAVREIATISQEGVPLDAIVDTSRTTDIANSLGVFFNIYDKDKQLVGGSGQINEQVPTVPDEAFEAAKQKPEHKFTWQPAEDVRVAAVLKQAPNDAGFVLAGRNLAVTDERLMQAMNYIGLAWIGLLILSGLLTWLITKMLENSNSDGNTSTIIVEETVTVQSDSE